MNSAPNFKDTLNNMAKLDDLTQFIQSSNADLERKRGSIIELVQRMQKQIETVRTQIDSLKSQGTTATTEMKQLIADADSKQKDTLKNVKATITSMINLDKLQTAVDNLGNDITSLTKVTTGSSDSKPPSSPPSSKLNQNAPTFDPAKPPVSINNASKPVTPNKQNGGYTYGKSRRSHRKYRTHRKRHMGGFKKSKKK